MALFSTSYTPPDVYTEEIFNAAGSATLIGNARIPVFIGEGQEVFTNTNVRLHRGSSSIADDQVAGENLSAQVDGVTRTFQLTYFPVVTGDGSGTVTSDVTKIQVLANDLPVNVLSLNGKTGQIVLADLVPVDTNLTVTYYFKRGDLLVQNEDLSVQVPLFASLPLYTVGNTVVSVSVSVPGQGGNNVSLQLSDPGTGNGVADASAVQGNGTDSIVVVLRNTNDSLRTYDQVVALLQTSIQTLSAGYLSVVSSTGTIVASSVAATAHTAQNLTGGLGQSTNTTFMVKNLPIVDGTNGGVITTNPAKVTAKVNGKAVTVAAVDGLNGLVTLAQGVAPNSQLQITYYTNTYQNTSDILTGASIAAVQSVGLGPNRSDFIAGVDYILSGNSIAWGASSATGVATSTPGFTPFDASVITNVLVDRQLYLQPVSGAVNGKNVVYVLKDSPVDGSGLSRVTDDPALISVYVGTDPIAAVNAGAVRVLRLVGSTGNFTLLNPPAVGQQVFATYRRSELNDHVYTLAVTAAGGPGAGTYTVTDELGAVAPALSVSATNVAYAAFRQSGVLFPHSFSDLYAPTGAASETVTLTFQESNNSIVVSPATQAAITLHDGSANNKLVLKATIPGTLGGEVLSVQLVGGPTGAADASAITVTNGAISVSIVKADNSTTRTWQDILTLFTTFPPNAGAAGVIICTAVSGADLTSQAVATSALTFQPGVDAVTVDVANRFTVSSNRTIAQANADHLGRTGNATTGVTGQVGVTGYLGQTFIDAQTGVTFTIVDPQNALAYGYTSTPSPTYYYQPGDTLTLSVNAAGNHVVGATPSIAISGLQMKVVTTLGMNVGDTATVQTFNKSGNTPNVGEFYYVSYTTNKQASDFALQLFSKGSDAYAQYGQPYSVANRMSLAIKLFLQNGGTQFACIQVPKQVGSAFASDQSFMDAIASLATGLPGSKRKPNVILPLSTSSTVQQYLGRYLTTQAAPENQGEAIGFIGAGRFMTSDQISLLAQAIKNQRVVLNSINAMGVKLQGPTDLQAVEYAVSGEFAAAQLAGAFCNPAIDVATTLTNTNLVGASRNLNPLDVPTMNALATAGVTVLVDNAGSLQVRHYKTTDPSTPLSSEPYITTIADYLAQASRASLRQFVGRKMTPDLPSSIQSVLNALLKANLNVTITAYNPATVVADAADPTTYDIVMSVKPMFSALYLDVQLQVNLAN